MMKCEAQFLQNHLTTNIDSAHQPQADSLASFKPYYVLLEDYKIIFQADPDDKTPIYQTSAGEIVLDLDKSSKVLTLSRKSSKSPFMKLHSDDSSLDRIVKYCETYNDDSILYNPLLYVPKRRPDEQKVGSKKTNNLIGYMLMGGIVILSSKIKDVITSYMTHGFLGIHINMLPHPIILVYSLGWLVIATSIMIATEKLALKKVLSNRVVALIEMLNLLIAFVFPADYCHRYKPDTLLGLFYVAWSLMLIMKMTSYMHFMYELRGVLPNILRLIGQNGEAADESVDKYISRGNLKIVEKYKDDVSKIINIKDVLYFFVAPTIVYQLWFPKTPRIRWSVVTKLSISLTLCCLFQFIWINQLFIPSLREAGLTFKNGTLLQKFEKVFEFANCFAVLIPTAVYSFFYAFLNLASEITRFDDRDFSEDWWNSHRVRVFWTRWNRPVHKWCQRHVYFPVLKSGYSKVIALIAVFFFSGVMHEYLFSIPSRVYVLYSLGMVSQVPIIILEKKFESFCERHSRENFFVWAFLGYTLAPFAIIQYYLAYMDTNDITA